jgi:hypothetical protein
MKIKKKKTSIKKNAKTKSPSKKANGIKKTTKGKFASLESLSLKELESYLDKINLYFYKPSKNKTEEEFEVFAGGADMFNGPSPYGDGA